MLIKWLLSLIGRYNEVGTEGIMPEEIKFNEQKSTEAASLLLHLKGGRSDYWWIIKLLYLIDRESLKRWERPVTYDLYESLPYGPVAMSIYNIIKKNLPSQFWKRYIVTLPKEAEVMLTGRPAKIRKLSKAELDLINEIFKEFGSLSGKELVEYTHTLPEWRNPKDSGEKALPLPIQEILTVLDYSSEEIDRITSEIKEEETIDAILGE